jgi:transposase
LAWKSAEVHIFLAEPCGKQRLEVQLIPAQYVKPYVKTNKSDYLDAEAIAEARRASQNR